MYEVFEHTADIGLRVRAGSRDELFAEAARGLFCLIIENPSVVRSTQVENVVLEGADSEYLFFDWLNELLFRFDSRHMVYADFRVRLGPAGLTAELFGEPLDPARHVLDHEVKAITYHELKVEQTADGWVAEVILDI